jgi:hypothetical protein
MMNSLGAMAPDFPFVSHEINKHAVFQVHTEACKPYSAFVPLGLVRLQARTRNFPWANVGILVRKPDAGKPPVRFDEREVETEHGMRLLRHSRGNPETDYVEAYPTAPPLDSTSRLLPR